METGTLDGRVALVTGGAAGIGRAAALAFARKGAAVAVSDIDGDGVQETAALVRAAGGDALCLTVDVGDPAQVEAMVAAVVARWGHLDCAFNNAGTEGIPTPIVDADDALFERVLRVNLMGVWLCCKHELRQMLLQPTGGAIVNTASVLGLVGAPGNPAYTASKHGVVGLTRSLALAHAADRIRVNALCPGYTESPMTERLFTRAPDYRAPVVARHPIGRLAAPEEIAEAAVWLCSDAASFVTGHALSADGGYTAQ